MLARIEKTMLNPIRRRIFLVLVCASAAVFGAGMMSYVSNWWVGVGVRADVSKPIYLVGIHGETGFWSLDIGTLDARFPSPFVGRRVYLSSSLRWDAHQNVYYPTHRLEWVLPTLLMISLPLRTVLIGTAIPPGLWIVLFLRQWRRGKEGQRGFAVGPVEKPGSTGT